MKKWKDRNGVEWISCDNLREFLSEFTKYRKSKDKVATKENCAEYACWMFDIREEEKNLLKSLNLNLFKETPTQGPEIKLLLDLSSTSNPVKVNEVDYYQKKIGKALGEIWETGQIKNYQELDLNWPQVKQPDQPPNKKKELEQPLVTLKYQKSPSEAEKILAAHIGFEKEKEWFKDQVYLYSATQGNFTPVREVICYVGAPGTGKTTFIYRLSRATGRPCQTIACAGQSDFNQFSILGSKDKPSLVAWAIKKSGCRNPLILLDELEKVSNHQILKDLIKLLSLYRQKEKLFDPYFQTEIDLSQITFFATVNYAEELPLLLANNLLIRKLEKLTPSEKKLILTTKSRQIEKEWGASEGEIIPPDLISELANFPEEGVRQSEAALYQVLKQWILWKADPANHGKKFSLGSSSEWLSKNVLIAAPSFQIKSKHYFLFALWGVIIILLLILLLKKWILKSSNEVETPPNKSTS